MTYGLGMHTWKSGKGLLDCSSSNTGRVRPRHSRAHYFLLSKFNNLYRVSPPKKTTYKDYMAYAPVKEYNEQNERAWPPPPPHPSAASRPACGSPSGLFWKGVCRSYIYISLHAARRAMAVACRCPYGQQPLFSPPLLHDRFLSRTTMGYTGATPSPTP